MRATYYYHFVLSSDNRKSFCCYTFSRRIAKNLLVWLQISLIFFTLTQTPREVIVLHI